MYFLSFSALPEYLRKDTNFNSAVAKGFLMKLKDIEQWFLSQNTYQFFATSLLFVYEGDTANCKAEENSTDIRMIDFPRVFPAEGQDENYLTGLRNLISYFESITQ